MLTDVQCRNAKLRDADYKLSDEKGLYLYVTRAGFRSWRWKYRFANKEKRLTFGPYPEVSLSPAREQRDRARALLRDGIDPGMERRQRAAAVRLEAENTFESVARAWHGAESTRWTPIHADDVLRSLERDVFSRIGNDPITSITAPIVLQLLREIESRAAIETARRVRQRMSAVFVYAIASGMAANDPAAIVQGALKPLRRGRQPAFTRVEDAQDLLRTMEAAPAAPGNEAGVAVPRPDRGASWSRARDTLDRVRGSRRSTTAVAYCSRAHEAAARSQAKRQNASFWFRWHDSRSRC